MKYLNDYLRELERDPDSRPRSRRAAAWRRTQRQAEETITLVESTENTEGGFNPSFHASRHERAWIEEYLGQFYHDHVITDVLRQVKGGKEATVYCCAAHPATGAALIAAKVYRPREFRTMRNDALYRQGWSARDEQGKETFGRREHLAMQKKTGFGMELRHSAWVGNEFGALRALHAAGADVPRAFAHSDNAILMEYFGTRQAPAPTLHEVRLDPAAAPRLFARLLENIEIMLGQGRVHGDLSAHNILYWDDRATIIDFPQAVDPLINPEARALLERDLARVCQYFARYGLTADPTRLAADWWRRYVLTGPEGG